LGAVSPSALEFDHISSKWLLVTSRSQNRMWALHLNGDEIAVSEVPSPAMTLAQGVTR
jgi:hypothetical protein